MRTTIRTLATFLMAVMMYGGTASAAARHDHALPRWDAKPVPASAVPCVNEDGSGGPKPCYWNAGTMGNGYGDSLWVDRRGAYHYYENDRLDFREAMQRRGFKRLRHYTYGHRLCFVKRGWDTAVLRCFDGLRRTS